MTYKLTFPAENGQETILTGSSNQIKAYASKSVALHELNKFQQVRGKGCTIHVEDYKHLIPIFRAEKTHLEKTNKTIRGRDLPTSQVTRYDCVLACSQGLSVAANQNKHIILSYD